MKGLKNGKSAFIGGVYAPSQIRTGVLALKGLRELSP
jgi:hypothetical protein